MSHRDRIVNNGSASHAQDLGAVIGWLLTGVDVSAIGFRQDCRWSATALITAALFWAWSNDKGLVKRFSTALKPGAMLAALGKHALGVVSSE